MDIEYYGANAIRLETKKTRIIVDDTLALQGKKSITKADDVSVQTDAAIPVADGGRLLLSVPGEYEVGDISVKAVGVRGHRDEEGKKTATVFKFTALDGNVVVAGHIHPDITDQQVEEIGDVDVLMVPVGGSGFTLDAEGALKVIKKLEPSVVIPTYFTVSGIKTEMPTPTLEEALNTLGMTVDESPRSNAAKLKNLELGAEQAKLVVLEPKV